jgi:hypothetical protein
MKRGGKYSGQKVVFSPRNRQPAAIAIFGPLDFPKKTRREPEGSIQKIANSPRKGGCGQKKGRKLMIPNNWIGKSKQISNYDVVEKRSQIAVAVVLSQSQFKFSTSEPTCRR